MANVQFWLTNSQRYLVNAKPGTNHSNNPTNPTYPANPTNPATKYRCEFVNLNCIYIYYIYIYEIIYTFNICIHTCAFYRRPSNVSKIHIFADTLSVSATKHHLIQSRSSCRCGVFLVAVPFGSLAASQIVTRSTRHSPKSYDELTGG